MFPDVRSFISHLERTGDLVRITEPVSPILEIAAIADRVSKHRAPVAPGRSAKRDDPRFHDRGGPAILFENVIGSSLPVLINAYGSYARTAAALGAPLHAKAANSNHDGFDAIAHRIGELVKPEPPRSLAEAIAKAKQFAPLLKIGPRRKRGQGACQQIVRTGDAVDLTELPILRCWPHDGDIDGLPLLDNRRYPANVNAAVPNLGHPSITNDQWERTYRGRYITLAGIHTIHADDRDADKPRSHNIGMYRVQLLGKNRLAMHWHMHHDGASHWRSWKKLGKPMPVAVVLGGHSVLPYAATCPLPPGISELLMAGFLAGRGIDMCRATTVPLWIPANSEIVIEGHVRTDAGYPGWDPRDPHAGPLGEGAVFEGPFGDHTGFYSLPDRYPLLEVSAVTRRTDAIYPTTVVGLPPQEDYFLGKATERIMLPLLKTIIHDIEDYDLPMFGAFHNCAVLRIRKAYPLHARRVMHAVWGAGQMSWTKAIFVVDDDCDPHDTFEVLRRAAMHCDPRRDIETVSGPLDILDHAAPRLAAGTKIGFDCTRKIPGEEISGIPVVDSEPLPADRFSKQARDDYLKAVRAVPRVLDAQMHDELPGWLFVGMDKQAQGDAVRALEHILAIKPHTAAESPAAPGQASNNTPARFIIALSPEADLSDPDACLFRWCAHTDVGRDAVYPTLDPATRAIAFDATEKTPADARNGRPAREWPPILNYNNALGTESTQRIERIIRSLNTSSST